MRTFVTATAGLMYPRGVHNDAATDAAFADLERQVDGLAARLKEVLKPGVIDTMVANAIKPFEGAIRACAQQVRNAALPPHIRKSREAGARVPGTFRLPAAN
jgi:hypothetical protein